MDNTTTSKTNYVCISHMTIAKRKRRWKKNLLKVQSIFSGSSWIKKGFFFLLFSFFLARMRKFFMLNISWNIDTNLDVRKYVFHYFWKEIKGTRRKNMYSNRILRYQVEVLYKWKNILACLYLFSVKWQQVAMEMLSLSKVIHLKGHKERDIFTKRYMENCWKLCNTFFSTSPTWYLRAVE